MRHGISPTTEHSQNWDRLAPTHRWISRDEGRRRKDRRKFGMTGAEQRAAIAALMTHRYAPDPTLSNAPKKEAERVRRLRNAYKRGVK